MSNDDVMAIERSKFRLECFKAVTPSRGDLPNHVDVGYYTSKAQALFDWCVAADTPERSGPVTNETAKKA